jgi:hypothetical protein
LKSSFLLSALTLPLALSAAAAEIESPQFVKAMDGKTAYCGTRVELGRAGYRPTSFRIRMEEGQIRLSLEVSSVICLRAGDGFAWQPRGFSEPIPGKTLDGLPTTLHLSGQEFLLVNEGYSVITAVPAGNSSTKAIDLVTSVESTLTPAGREALQRGLPVRARLAFFLRGIVTVEVADGSVIHLGQRAGGAYFINFTLRLNPSTSALEIFAAEIR